MEGRELGGSSEGQNVIYMDAPVNAVMTPRRNWLRGLIWMIRRGDAVKEDGACTEDQEKRTGAAR